jgi:hypothetical protein
MMTDHLTDELVGTTLSTAQRVRFPISRLVVDPERNSDTSIAARAEASWVIHLPHASTTIQAIVFAKPRLVLYTARNEHDVAAATDPLLSQHRGTVTSKGGNHRGSIFRLRPAAFASAMPSRWRSFMISNSLSACVPCSGGRFL